MGKICFYTGDERYLIDSRIKFTINEFKADEYNTFSYDMEEVNVKEALRDASTPPFMSESKAIIIKNPKFLTNEKCEINHDLKSLIRYIQNPNETTLLVIDGCGLKIDEKNEIVKLLKQKKTEVHVAHIDETVFSGWFRRQLETENIKVRDDAVKLFYSLVGKNMLNAKTEVDKLISYVSPQGVITVDVINKVVIKEVEQDVYQLANAILDNNKEKVINTYRDLIASFNDVNRLLYSVTSSIKDELVTKLLLKAGYKQNDLVSILSVSPGKAYYLIKNSKNISEADAKDYIIKLGDLDYKIKSGQIDPKTGFEFFLFGI